MSKAENRPSGNPDFCDGEELRILVVGYDKVFYLLHIMRLNMRNYVIWKSADETYFPNWLGPRRT